MHELKNGELSVGRLTEKGVPQSSIYRHLALLRERGVVNTRRGGTTIYYRLASPRIAQACDLVREVLEGQLAHSQKLASSLNSLRK